MQAYRRLNEADVLAYVRELPGLFSENAMLEVQEIGDGNMNYVFRIFDRKSQKSVIVKQAVPYIRVIGEAWPLTLDRARIEAEALKMEYSLCPSFVPQVYHFNKDYALIVMEDLSSFQILRKGLIERKQYPFLAQHVGIFVARMLFFTSIFGLDESDRKKQEMQYSNPELSQITGGVVFTDPFHDAEMNRFNPLIKDKVYGLWGNQELKLEVAKLKEKFFTHPQALIHGDLHTGSIMVTEKETKIIDPEFAFFGPIGFDIGAFMANILLNYASQEAEFRGYLLETVKQIWLSFEKEFMMLCQTQSKEQNVTVPGYLEDYLLRVLQDSLGYAGCKMLRRVIGVAHVADLEGIEDDQVRAKAERLAITIGERLILSREAIKSIEEVIEMIKR